MRGATVSRRQVEPANLLGGWWRRWRCSIRRRPRAPSVWEIRGWRGLLLARLPLLQRRNLDTDGRAGLLSPGPRSRIVSSRQMRPSTIHRSRKNEPAVFGGRELGPDRSGVGGSDRVKALQIGAKSCGHHPCQCSARQPIRWSTCAFVALAFAECLVLAVAWAARP
jgi:hypothetical protein